MGHTPNRDANDLEPRRESYLQYVVHHLSYRVYGRLHEAQVQYQSDTIRLCLTCESHNVTKRKNYASRTVTQKKPYRLIVQIEVQYTWEAGSSAGGEEQEDIPQESDLILSRFNTYAPSPESILSPIFSKEMINADLDELIKRQKSDGRWDTWYGLSEGMKLEWAGIQTLWALKTLNNYGRLEK